MSDNCYDAIELYGEAADDFLYESGITLYEDCIVLEGEQAEEYLRKKEERAEKERKEENRKYGLHGPRSSKTYDWRDEDNKQATPTTDRNPRYDKAREMKRLRNISRRCSKNKT